MTCSAKFFLGTVAAFVGPILLLAAFLFIVSGHCAIGELTWWQYPACSPHPWFERISYKGKTLYTGFGEQDVDIDMSYRGLIHIVRLGEEDIFYDASRRCFVSEREAQHNYPYEMRRDDELRSNYCTLLHQDEVPKPLFFQRVKGLEQ